jgi:hypothetical protein
MMPAATTETRSITLRLPAPLFDRLLAAAVADRRSMNNMAALLLEAELDRRSFQQADHGSESSLSDFALAGMPLG